MTGCIFALCSYSLAVFDRIDFSSLSDVVADHVFINPSSSLPSTTDLNVIKKEFQVHISRYDTHRRVILCMFVCAYIIHRVLVQCITSFYSQKNKVTWHISSKYSATKSNVASIVAVLGIFDLKILRVPLGVLFFIEDEMCSVLKKICTNMYCTKENCKVTYH